MIAPSCLVNSSFVRVCSKRLNSPDSLIAPVKPLQAMPLAAPIILFQRLELSFIQMSKMLVALSCIGAPALSSSPHQRFMKYANSSTNIVFYDMILPGCKFHGGIMNFLCQRVEQFIVVVHTQNHPSKGEWESVLEAIYSDKLPVLGALVSTEGGSPSAFQRRQLRDALIRHKSEGQFSAVLTHSTIARMAIMALNLSLGNRIKAFPPNAVSEALSYIKAPPSLWSPLAHVLAALQAQLQPRYLLRLR